MSLMLNMATQLHINSIHSIFKFYPIFVKNFLPESSVSCRFSSFFLRLIGHRSLIHLINHEAFEKNVRWGCVGSSCWPISCTTSSSARIHKHFNQKWKDCERNVTEPHLTSNRLVWEMSSSWPDVNVHHFIIIDFFDWYIIEVVWTYHQWRPLH